MNSELATLPATENASSLLLVRMSLPSKTAIAPSKVRKDLSTLLNSELIVEAFDELRRELASGGFLEKGKRNSFALTNDGRARALQFLGISALPPRTNWGTVISKYLFPIAAKLSLEAAARLDDADKLSAFMLKCKYDLPDVVGSSVSQIMEAIVCKEVGFPKETTLNGLVRTVLSNLIGTEQLPKDKLIKQVPLFETGLTEASAHSVRLKIVRDWLRGTAAIPHTPDPQNHEQFELDTFVATVRALVANSPQQDRFYDNKVFISALWRSSQRESNFPRLSLAAFKEHLVEANSKHLLHLSRADLVQEMDPQMIAESETEYLNATFHFVLREGDRP